MRARILLAVFAGLFLSTTAGGQHTPELILYHGKIFTSSAARPYVQALAIREGRIVAKDRS